MDPLYPFVFAGLFSPGPNVILLTTSGALFGFRATIPHIFGVAAGVGVIAAASSLGVGAILLAYPVAALVMKIAAASWILYMASTLWRAKPADPKARQVAKPFTFLQAVMFQWVNPKVWAVSLAAAAGFGAGGTLLTEALRLSSAFSGINLFVCLFWAAAGTALARLLTTPRAWNIFRKTMASALALTAAMVFM